MSGSLQFLPEDTIRKNMSEFILQGRQHHPHTKIDRDQYFYQTLIQKCSKYYQIKSNYVYKEPCTASK